MKNNDKVFVIQVGAVSDWLTINCQTLFPLFISPFCSTFAESSSHLFSLKQDKFGGKVSTVQIFKLIRRHQCLGVDATWKAPGAR